MSDEQTTAINSCFRGVPFLRGGDAKFRGITLASGASLFHIEEVADKGAEGGAEVKGVSQRGILSSKQKSNQGMYPSIDTIEPCSSTLMNKPDNRPSLIPTELCSNEENLDDLKSSFLFKKVYLSRPSRKWDR